MTPAADALWRAASCFPDKEAIVDRDSRRTWVEVAERAQRLHEGLRTLGLEDGDRIAILADNSGAYVELLLAVPACGFVAVPVNQRLAPPERSALLDEAAPAVLLTDRADEEVDDLRRGGFKVLRLPTGLEELIATSEPLTLSSPREREALAAIYYTGGTTGRSKGVMSSHRNEWTKAVQMIAALGLVETDRWLVMSPMFHAAGTFTLLSSAMLGATVVVLERFDAAGALELIESEAVTASFGVPTMLHAIVTEQRRTPRDVSTLRLLGYGGAAMPGYQLEALADAFPHTNLLSGYGATEVSAVGTFVDHHEGRIGTARQLSCGRPVIGVDMRFVDDAGRPVGKGIAGEILIRSDGVFPGYWNRPEETEVAMYGRYYRTGDIGYIDDEGFVFIVDRKKDMIISGGENVYSLEVENALLSHSAVREVAVFGVPDEHWGESVAAVVTVDGDVQLPDLQAHVRQIIAGYKVPRAVQVITEPLPRTSAGKIDKQRIRSVFLGEEFSDA